MEQLNERLKRSVKIRSICFWVLFASFVGLSVICLLKDRIISKQRQAIAELTATLHDCTQSIDSLVKEQVFSPQPASPAPCFLAAGTSTALRAPTLTAETAQSASDSTNASASLAVAPALTSTTQLPPHDEIMRELRKAARERRVYWDVWCTAYFKGDKEEYSGIATTGKPFNIYIEEGAKAHWFVNGYGSPDAAAYALLMALKGPPTAAAIRLHSEPSERAVCKFQSWTGTPNSTTSNPAAHSH